MIGEVSGDGRVEVKFNRMFKINLSKKRRRCGIMYTKQ